MWILKKNEGKWSVEVTNRYAACVTLCGHWLAAPPIVRGVNPAEVRGGCTLPVRVDVYRRYAVISRSDSCET